MPYASMRKGQVSAIPNKKNVQLECAMNDLAWTLRQYFDNNTILRHGSIPQLRLKTKNDVEVYPIVSLFRLK